MADPRLILPIYVAGSHVRMTTAHASALFDEPLTPLLPIGDTELRPCLETVTVRIGEHTLESVRVVIGPIKTTEVHLSQSRLASIPDDSLHLDGPRGTVVLATAPRVITRQLTLTDDDASSLAGEKQVTVHVAADRARVFNDVPVVSDLVSALWVEAEDLNSLDLAPDARAHVL
jgi:propanediol utilization protein